MLKMLISYVILMEHFYICNVILNKILMETMQKVYVIERYSSVSHSNVVQSVFSTFDLAQSEMHAQIQNDIRCFRKSEYQYPIVSSSVDIDLESAIYNLNFKHNSDIGKVFKDIFIKYTISSFSVRRFTNVVSI